MVSEPGWYKTNLSMVSEMRRTAAMYGADAICSGASGAPLRGAPNVAGSAAPSPGAITAASVITLDALLGTCNLAANTFP